MTKHLQRRESGIVPVRSSAFTDESALAQTADAAERALAEMARANGLWKEPRVVIDLIVALPPLPPLRRGESNTRPINVRKWFAENTRGPSLIMPIRIDFGGSYRWVPAPGGEIALRAGEMLLIEAEDKEVQPLLRVAYTMLTEDGVAWSYLDGSTLRRDAAP